MILPPPPPPPHEAATNERLVKLVLRLRSKEHVASSVPAPDLAIPAIAPQAIVEADPTDSVAWFVKMVDESKPTGALDVPVMVNAPVMVVVVV